MRRLTPKIFTVREYSLVLLLEKMEKSSLNAVTWGSLASLQFADNSMQSWAQEVKARLVDLGGNAMLCYDAAVE